MITIDNVYKYFIDQCVLDGITLNIEKGSRLILMGQNGAGKTTLIRCILGEYRVNSGKISVGGYDPVGNRTDTLKQIAFVPQLPPPLKFTVSELIDYACGVSGCDKKTVIETCGKLELDIAPHIAKAFHKLSGGMKQKLLIAIAFARKTEMMIFDEPTANLDPKGRLTFRNLLNETAENTTIIFISHRIEEVSNLVNQVIELDMGKVVRNEKI